MKILNKRKELAVSIRDMSFKDLECPIGTGNKPVQQFINYWRIGGSGKDWIHHVYDFDGCNQCILHLLSSRNKFNRTKFKYWNAVEQISLKCSVIFQSLNFSSKHTSLTVRLHHKRTSLRDFVMASPNYLHNDIRVAPPLPFFGLDEKFICISVLSTHHKNGDDQSHDRAHGLNPRGPLGFIQLTLNPNRHESGSQPDTATDLNVSALEKVFKSFHKGIVPCTTH